MRSDIGPPVRILVKSNLGAGFFAEVQRVVQALLYWDDHEITGAFVDWSQEFFPFKDDPAENGWDLFFEPIRCGGNGTPAGIAVDGTGRHELHDQLCLDPWLRYDEHLPYRLSVNRCLQRFLEVKDAIAAKADFFHASWMAGAYCVGVHLRYAAAHVCEAPDPEPEEYLEAVAGVLGDRRGENVRVFLATDSDSIVALFKTRFPDQVLCLEGIPRSRHREEPHLIFEDPSYWTSHPAEFHARKPGYRGGEGTLLDCMLLSRCDLLIHGISNVASFASFLNPHLRSLYLPRTTASKACRYAEPSRLVQVKHRHHIVAEEA